MLVTITGFISLIGLSILGVNYAHILAIIMALLDVLPIVGPGTVFYSLGALGVLFRKPWFRNRAADPLWYNHCHQANLGAKSGWR